MSRNAFFAGSHQMEGLQPLVKRNVRPLHYRFHGDGEVLAAALFGASVHARALGLVGVVDSAAMRADRTFRPQDALKHSAGSFVVLEVRFAEKALGHGPLLRSSDTSP